MGWMAVCPSQDRVSPWMSPCWLFLAIWWGWAAANCKRRLAETVTAGQVQSGAAKAQAQYKILVVYWWKSHISTVVSGICVCFGIAQKTVLINVSEIPGKGRAVPQHLGLCYMCKSSGEIPHPGILCTSHGPKQSRRQSLSCITPMFK